MSQMANKQLPVPESHLITISLFPPSSRGRIFEAVLQTESAHSRFTVGKESHCYKHRSLMIPTGRPGTELQDHAATFNIQPAAGSFRDPTAKPSLSQAQLFLLLLPCYGANTQL